MDDGAGYGVETAQLEAAQATVGGLADRLPGGAGVCIAPPAVPATGDDTVQAALSAFDTDWTVGDTRMWDDLTRLAGAFGLAAEYYAKAEARAQARIATLEALAQTLPRWAGSAGSTLQADAP